MYKKKGFTLVELLVVIAIIALLMGILMPALARVRNIAMRMTCGTNLSGIGKAILIYTGDYDDEFPRGGYSSRSTLYKALPDWTASLGPPWGDNTATNDYGHVTITSCLNLLVKYADVMPKLFVCKNDTGTKLWSMGLAKDSVSPGFLDGKELIDLWDFGEIFTGGDNPNPLGADLYCSYSYQHPFTLYYLTTTTDPGVAVAADRNPWIQSPADEDGLPESIRDEFRTAFAADVDMDALKVGNAIPHQREGQNVLFADIHVDFEKNSACGVDDDNIYTRYRISTTTYEPIGHIEIGILPPPETETLQQVQGNDEGDVGWPGNRKDSYLIGNALGVRPDTF